MQFIPVMEKLKFQHHYSSFSVIWSLCCFRCIQLFFVFL